MQPLARLLFDDLDLSFDEQAHAMPGEVNLRNVDVQMLRDFLQRPALDRAQVKNLVLLRADFAFHARQRRVENVRLPFRVPDLFQFDSRGDRATDR